MCKGISAPNKLCKRTWEKKMLDVLIQSTAMKYDCLPVNIER
jgi:hypothetical protein